MPNWVRHNLTITGLEGERKRFMAECFTDSEEGPQFDFDRLIPQPAHIKASTFGRGPIGDPSDTTGDFHGTPAVTVGREPGFPAWYEWRCEFWGDKWNATTDGLKVFDDKIELHFSTAWAIPGPILDAIAERFPKLRIEGSISEGMMNFGGDIVIEGGKIDYTDLSDEIQAAFVAACSD